MLLHAPPPFFAEAVIRWLDEVALQQGGVDFDVWRAEISHNDRAILEGEEHGFCKVLAGFL